MTILNLQVFFSHLPSMTSKQVSYLISALLVLYFFYWNYSPMKKPEVNKPTPSVATESPIAEPPKTEVIPEPLKEELPKELPPKIIVEDITLPMVDPELIKINDFINIIFELDAIELQMKEYLGEMDKIQFSDLVFEHDLNQLKETSEFKEYLVATQKGFKTFIEQKEKLNYDDSLPLDLDYSKKQEIQDSWVEKIKTSLSGLFIEEEETIAPEDEVDKIYLEMIETAKKEKIVENLITILKSYKNNELKESDLLKITKKENKDFTLISLIFNTQMEFIEIDFSLSKEDAPFLREGKSVDGIVLLNEKTVLQFTANYKALDVEEWFNFEILSYLPGSWTKYLKSLDIPRQKKNYKFCYEEGEKNTCEEPF